MVDIIDVAKVYKRHKQDWSLWTAPLRADKWWYSQGWYDEVMEGFEQATGGMKIIFITLPVIPR